MRVAVGIIEKDGKYLCGQRRPDKKLADQWEFPGGKIESNETSEQALRREIREELGVEVVNQRFFRNIKYQYDFGLADIDFYYCEIADYNFRLTEHEIVKWFSMKELENLNLVGAAKKVIKEMKM